MAGKRGVSSTRDPVLRRAKLTQMVELAIRGVPTRDLATLMGVGTKTIENWKNEAKRTGIIEEVTARFQNEMLPKAASVYNAILDADVEQMTQDKTTKAHELKLKAARDIAQGLGVLRKNLGEVRAKKVLDLDGYMELRKARHVLEDKRGQQRPLPPDTVEGVVIPSQENEDGSNRQPGLQTEGAQVSDREGRGPVEGDGSRDEWANLLRAFGAGSDQAGDQGDGEAVRGEGAGSGAPVDEGDEEL